MDSIISLSESRKARSAKSDMLQVAASDLLTLLDRQRQCLSEEFMTFLLATAIADQALFYAEQAQHKKEGAQFLDHLFNTARQLFEVHYQKDNPTVVPTNDSGARILDFLKQSPESPENNP